MTTPSLKDWLTPKAIATVGVPTAIAMFLLAVLTGLLPTPLMEALTIITNVSADHEGQTSILDEMRYLQRIECIRESETADDRSDCYLPVSK